MTTILAYENTRQYLHEFFSLLALRLHRQVALARLLRGANEQDAFLGLFLSEQEIDRVLAELHGLTLAKEMSTPLEAQEQALAAHIAARLSATQQPLRTRQLGELYDLPPQAIEVLLLLLALEVDSRFSRVYAYLQDDVTHRWLSPGLAMRLLPGALPDDPRVRQWFTASSPLVVQRLVQVGERGELARLPLLDRPLKLDDRIAEFLLEHDPLPASLADLITVSQGNKRFEDLPVAADQQQQLAHLAESLQRPGAPPVFFWGRAGSGKATAAEAVASAIGRPLLILDAERLTTQANDQVTDLVRLGTRELDLRQAILLVRRIDRLDERSLAAVLPLLLRPGVIMSSRSPLHFHDQRQLPLAVHFLLPDHFLRQRLWQAALDGHPHLNGPLPAELAGRFRLTAGQISQATTTAYQQARLRSGAGAAPAREDLFEGCRQQASPGLARMATKVTTPYQWEDLVLPAQPLELLQAMESHIRLLARVYHDWGFDQRLALGKGLNALFAGPSGTGKTMAAGILANALELDMYKIDLSSVVSKYIGETEKNLSQIFDDAATANAILFFDEADALFGKRSEVKDAHDRYANIEISYLLQKMEEYDGMAILATNLSQNLDEAFTRRMQFVIEFPFPSAADRARIWRGLFPAQAPVASDIDFSFLANQFELAGGNIKNCVLAAAFLAAAEGAPIGMAQLLQAIVREYGKLGRPITRALFVDYFAQVRRKRS